MGRINPFAEYKNIPGAYIIEEPESGKKYIGGTGNLGIRLNIHKNDLKRGCSMCVPLQELHNSGKEFNYQFFPTESKDKAFDLEQKLLDENKNSEHLLNKATDSRASFRGKQHTDEFKQMVSSVHKGKVLSDETKEKLRTFRLGRKTPKEIVEKVSLINKITMSDPNNRIKKCVESPNREIVEINGVEFQSLRQAAKVHNVDHKTVKNRSLSSDPKYEKWIMK